MIDHFINNPITFGVLALSYLVGSIPFGYLLTRLSGKGDIRDVGSGNIGATNVLRTGNKLMALLTLLLDGAKGFLAVHFAHRYQIQDWAAGAVMLGHMFPIWLKFRGGKGVATYGGILFGLSVPLGAQAVLAWLSFLVIFGYSSLAALLAAILVPVTVWLWSYGEPLLYTTCVLGGFLIIKHYENIVRLLKGTEPKVRNKG